MICCKMATYLFRGVFIDAYFHNCLYGVSGCITTRIGNNKYYITELKDEQNNDTDKRGSR